MQEKLEEAEKYLQQAYENHHNYAKDYSYKSVCENRFTGQEKFAQTAKENALVHHGLEKGIADGLYQIRQILEKLKVEK